MTTQSPSSASDGARFCVGCACYIRRLDDHPSQCPQGQMERRDATIAELEARLVKVETALGLCVHKLFPQFGDPLTAGVLARMEKK